MNNMIKTTHDNLPTKILKSSSEATVNEAITRGVFPDNLKLADITQVLKKDDLFDKKATDQPAFYRLYLNIQKNGAKTNNYITNHLSRYVWVLKRLQHPTSFDFSNRKMENDFRQ